MVKRGLRARKGNRRVQESQSRPSRCTARAYIRFGVAPVIQGVLSPSREPRHQTSKSELSKGCEETTKIYHRRQHWVMPQMSKCMSFIHESTNPEIGYRWRLRPSHHVYLLISLKRP